MINNGERKKIKSRVVEVVESFSDDIKGLYYIEQTGELHKKYKRARTDEQKLDAIGLEDITQTRVTVAISIKTILLANVPELYHSIEKSIKESLQEIKYTLYNFKLKIVDID